MSTAFVVIPLTFGFTIAVLVYVFESASGGHINPAVSLAFAVTGHISPVRLVIYWVAQFLGAAVGAGFVKAIAPHAFDQTNGGYNSLRPNSKNIASNYHHFTKSQYA